MVDEDSSADEGSYHSDGNITDDNPKISNALSPPYNTARRKSQEGNQGVAQDVINRRGQYGRFAERWFSRKGWTSERRRAQGMSADQEEKSEDSQVGEQAISNQVDIDHQSLPKEDDTQPIMTSYQASKDGPAVASTTKDVTSSLVPRLLRTTKMLFASHSFFFSYDYDITRRLGDQKTKSADLPLHRNVDPLVRCSPK